MCEKSRRRRVPEVHVVNASVPAAAGLIRSGGVIAYPTEAVYGLGCDPRHNGAVERLIALKDRDVNKGLILVASQWTQLDEFVSTLSREQHDRVTASWPGPVTWILPARDTVDTLITGGRASIAVRISAHPVVASLCNACGHALVSTSANSSGQAPLRDARAVTQHFGDRIDAVVAGSLGSLDRPTPIFDITTGKQLR